MNILISAMILIIISLANYRVAKNVLYPAFIFSCYWATLLLLLLILPNHFYQLSNRSLTIFTIGAAFFSLGSFLALKFGTKSNFNSHNNRAISNAQEFNPWLKNFLLIGLAVAIITLPYYCYYLYNLVSMAHQSPSDIGMFHLMNLARELRKAITHSNGLGMFKYLIAGISFLGLISLVEYTQGRCTRLILISYTILALIYHFLSTQRTGLILFILSFLMLYFISQRKTKMSSLLFSAIFIALAFFIPAIILQKGSSVHAGILQNLSSLFINIQTYILGGMVAFDKGINSPVIAEYFPYMYSLRFLFLVFHHLGFAVQPPEIILPYIFTPYPINIYTMYFSWFIDFSWFGILIITFLLGILSTISYKSALNKEPAGLVFYSALMAGILLGTIGDFFLIGLSFWGQLIFYILLAYKTPLILKYFCKTKVKHAGNA